MKLQSGSTAWANPCLRIWICLYLFSLAGCGPESDYKRIDFSKKIDIARGVSTDSDRKPLRVAIGAMISPKETLIYYHELIDFLGDKLGHDIELVQRKTYSEVNELLAKGQIDLAFICTGPYVVGKAKYGFEAIATPIVRGEPFYRSYLIVHRDSDFKDLSDLKGKSFAFTDPESNTGSLVPRFWLDRLGVTPESFFSSFTYTYSHDNAIMAVAKNLVDAAAVDGHMWEYFQHRNPYYSSKTRVIKKSDPFGSPPLVVSSALDSTLKSTIRNMVLAMHEDQEGRRILTELMIDRFAAPETGWYSSVIDMLIQFQSRAVTENASEKP